MFRKLGREERAKMAQLSTRKCSLQHSFAQLTSVSSSHRTIAKATPSLPDTQQRLSAVPVISEDLLQSDMSTDTTLGSGRFGHCTRMIYKDIFTVCVKKVDPDVSWSAVKLEAAILYALNTGDVTPHCFGACVSLHSIVMSCIHVDDKPMTLHTLLHKQEDPDIAPSDKQCTSILVGVCKGLQFIHGRGYLHNDVKLDNIVLGATRTGELKPYIIDFGKARQIDCGKMYTLSDSERQQFKVEHNHIAPDLRDGLVPQSVATDIYSYGRVIKQCNSIVIRSIKLKDFNRIILSYHSNDRPQLDNILNVLTQI